MQSETKPQEVSETPEQLDIRLNKDVAAFSYIWIMSFVVYAARRNSSFAQFHSKQGIVLFLMSFVWIIPFVGHFLAMIVVAGMVLGFIHASQGKKLDVPFVGPLSRGETNIGHYAEGILKAFEHGYQALKSHITSKKKAQTTDSVSSSTMNGQVK